MIILIIYVYIHVGLNLLVLHLLLHNLLLLPMLLLLQLLLLKLLILPGISQFVFLLSKHIQGLERSARRLPVQLDHANNQQDKVSQYTFKINLRVTVTCTCTC